MLQSTYMLPLAGPPESQLSKHSSSAASEKTQENVTVHRFAMSAGAGAQVAPFSSKGSAFAFVRLKTNSSESRCLRKDSRLEARPAGSTLRHVKGDTHGVAGTSQVRLLRLNTMQLQSPRPMLPSPTKPTVSVSFSIAFPFDDKTQ